MLMNKEVMEKIKEEHPLCEEATEEEYVRMREERIRALLAVAGVEFHAYHKYLEMSKKGVQVVLQRDIEEVNINPYNVQWLEVWNGNLDIQPVQDFFGVITYITEYAFKPEPQEAAIKRALESVKDENMEKKMKVIAQSFQDNREMGEAEATYKMLPNLQMAMSNVGKQWVCLSRPEERTTRARQATQADIKAGKEVFELENVEGTWMEQWDMRSKYERRDPKCWNISFSQFARIMAASNKGSEKEETGEDVELLENVEGIEQNKESSDEPWYVPFHRVMDCSHQCCTDQPKEECEGECCLPMPRRSRLSRVPRKVAKSKEVPEMMELGSPHTGEPKKMRRRRIPATLRFYKHNKETNPIRFFLQELILFVPFGLAENGDTENLLKETDDQIVKLYDKYSEHIKEVKRQVLPFLEDVTEERFYVEKIRRELDAEEVGLQMAAGKELDNLEAMDVEVTIQYLKIYQNISCIFKYLTIISNSIT